MAKYVRLTRGFKDYGVLLDPKQLKLNDDSPAYQSIYYYNDDHLQKFKETNSVRGFTGVVTDKVIFDFDNEHNLDLAKADALTTIDRLQTKLGINPKYVEIYYSGYKGFGLGFRISSEITPEQHEALANTLAGDLDTFDTTMYDANQILRIPNTRHNTSNLYKIQLTYDELKSKTIEEIQALAKTPRPVLTKAVMTIPKDFLQITTLKKEKKMDKSNNTTAIPKSTVYVGEHGKLPLTIEQLKLDKRPNYWKDYKWSLLQGNFNIGERRNAMIVVAATCKALGYDRDLTEAMLNSMNDKHCALTGNNQDTDNLNGVLRSVFDDEYWQGGQYSYRNNLWLQKYVDRLGITIQQEADEPVIQIGQALDLFKDYAKNIDALTITTGIEPLDKNLTMTIGMLVGIVGAAGSGKSSLALSILNNMSKKGEQCLFFSYDMYHSLVIQKLIQKHLGKSGDEIFNAYKNDNKEFQQKVEETFKENYANVEFCFKTGQTPDDMVQTLKYAEEKTGKKVRLILVDYSELVLSEKENATDASAYVIQKLREIAIMYNTCVVVLLQPNKMAGDPSQPILSYAAAKGSSAIQQAVGIMLGIYREGFNPRNPGQDRFLTISALKNRMGGLFSIDLAWDGFSGEVGKLAPDEVLALQQIREANEADDDDNGWS